MDNQTKILELIERLIECYPRHYINIDKKFDRHRTKPNRISISYHLYINGIACEIDIKSIVELESIVDRYVIRSYNER